MSHNPGIRKKEQKPKSAEDREFMILESRFPGETGLCCGAEPKCGPQYGGGVHEALRTALSLVKNTIEEQAERVRHAKSKVDHWTSSARIW